MRRLVPPMRSTRKDTLSPSWTTLRGWKNFSPHFRDVYQSLQAMHPSKVHEGAIAAGIADPSLLNIARIQAFKETGVFLGILQECSLRWNQAITFWVEFYGSQLKLLAKS